MDQRLGLEFLTLAIYTLFMGFCFCDGFKLHIVRKLIWFLTFLAVSASVFKATGHYDLASILPAPTLLAVLLCAHENQRNKKKNTAGQKP